MQGQTHCFRMGSAVSIINWRLMSRMLNEIRQQPETLARTLASELRGIEKFIVDNLQKQDLAISSVATANHLSPRQIQRFFEAEGTTFSEFVLEQRLLLARRLLLQEASRHRKVSDIAYTAGFNDLSYFHRSFRKRFGMTPSDMRAEFVREQ